ncbi:MAG: hypothetical protein Q7T07_17070 [Burkholderiaceae bacterium]|nr:hypothetical protein [Burkholderiaceae bacterium]
MTLKPLHMLNQSNIALTGGLVRALTLTGRVVGDAAGAGVGVGVRMSLSMVLATLMPQLSLAQDEPSASRQPIKHSRRVEQGQSQSYTSEDKMLKVNAAPAPQAVNFARAVPRRVEVVDAVPKLNEKYLSTEELRLMRKQLLEQR